MKKLLVLIVSVALFMASCSHRGLHGGCKNSQGVHRAVNEASRTGHL